MGKQLKFKFNESAFSLRNSEFPSDVPFVNEVETFNRLTGKPNNYKPIIPEEKEWKFVYDFILEELEEYKEA